VREQQHRHGATVVLIEDKASGTQLIQELIADGCHAVTRYQPTIDKTMRLHAQTAMIENGFVCIPERGDRVLGLFPERAHRSLDALSELRAIYDGLHELAGNTTKPVTSDDVVQTRRNIREQTKVG
jgi:phage terminase large subunit-like protein